MSDTFITVTIIGKTTQIGMYDYRTERYSRNFSTSRSIDDMLSWAKNMGVENPGICDLCFYNYTGGSV